MACEDESFDLLDYMAGLTTYLVDESVLRRIARERCLLGVSRYSDLSERDRDLLLADILYTVYLGGDDLPSVSEQHGQFSITKGKQSLSGRASLLPTIRYYYSKWSDAHLALLPVQESGLSWIDESKYML